MQQHFDIAIVGGGFSGTALAIHLMGRRGPSGLRVALIEAGDRVGRGLAYGTQNPAHVLNTRAQHMSLFGDDPEHFRRWLEEHGAPSDADSFVPRMTYGDYVEDTLIESLAARGARAPAFIAYLGCRASTITRDAGAYRIELDKGERLAADNVVLATGHPLPADPLAAWIRPDAPRYLRNPWNADDLAKIGRSDRVLILGTGLTMVDCVLALEAQGHSGEIRATSRRGLLPRPHAPAAEHLPADLRAVLEQGVGVQNVRQLLQRIRHTAVQAALRGLSWHTVMDALRPLTPRLWSGLPVNERRRFLRLLRPYWEVHRHRLPAEAARALQDAKAGGRLVVEAGRVMQAAEEDDRILVVRRVHRKAICVDRFDWVVNCTGPSFQAHRGLPLNNALLSSGLLQLDALGLGYETTPSGQAVGANGPVEGLYVLGPACKPHAFEQTAVAELRTAAERLASELLRSARRTTRTECTATLTSRLRGPFERARREAVS